MTDHNHHHDHSKHHHDKSDHKKFHDHHGHHHHAISSYKLLALSVILTLGLAGIEAIAGYYSHSLTLLSDAGHMLADSLSLVLAAFAAWVAAKPPSLRHTFGLGRAEVISALASSVFIILVVIGLTVEAVKRLQEPPHVVGGAVIVVAVIGIIVNLIVAWIISYGEETFNSRAALLHVLGDLIGTVAALTAGAVIYYTHWLPIDPILSLFICLLILISSLRLMRDTFIVLMEGVPAHLTLSEVGTALATNHNKIKSIHDLHIWTLSSGKVILSAHIVLDDIRDWPDILNNLRKFLQHKYKIEHVTLQPEVNVQVLQEMPYRRVSVDVDAK